MAQRTTEIVEPLSQEQEEGMTLKTGKGTQANYYIIQEDITQGERIRAYRVEARLNGKWSAIDRGTSVGHKRIESSPPLKLTRSASS